MSAAFIEQISGLLPLVMKEFSRRYSNDISRGKLTLPQFYVMDFLFSHGQAKMNELARSLSVSTAAATGIVDRLVRSGYVIRKPDISDRRVIKVCLAGKGRKLMESVIRQRRLNLEEVLGQLSSQEQDDYLRILKRVYSIVSGFKKNEI